MNTAGFTHRNLSRPSITTRAGLCVAFVVTMLSAIACHSTAPKPERARPHAMAEVPAERLAYRFAADTGPPAALAETDDTPLQTIQADFDARRQTEALLRTVVSPDGQRALALYATSDMPQGIFRLDLYATDGKFLRNITPPELACAFQPSVAWSPDGQWIAFIARRDPAAIPALQPTPTAVAPTIKGAEQIAPGGAETAPTPTPIAGPLFAPVETYATEQIYLADRDGFNLRPLTKREGLIYFYFAWAPNDRADAMVALACREDEWQTRVGENKSPAGRPRLILMDGSERLLDDRATDVLPVWSPDAAKIATAFETEVAIYDASIKPSAGARLALHDQLLTASVRYDEMNLQEKPDSAENTNATKQNKTPTPTPTPTIAPAEPAMPLSFNAIVRLEWPQVETLYAQTGFVRVYANETINNYLRWHTIALSPQASLLSRAARPDDLKSQISDLRLHQRRRQI